MMYITKDSWLSSGEISLYFVRVWLELFIWLFKWFPKLKFTQYIYIIINVNINITLQYINILLIYFQYALRKPPSFQLHKSRLGFATRGIIIQNFQFYLILESNQSLRGIPLS